MKVLVITRSAWDDSNSIGNTMTNLFGNWPSTEIANIYVREAKPNNPICLNYYSISDKAIINSIYKRKFKAGKSFVTNKTEFVINENLNSNLYNEEIIYRYFRQKSSVFALWGQDILWKLGDWKNENLDNYLASFNPDIIFAPSFHTKYTHKLMWYIQEKTNAKLVLFHADDYLFSVSNGDSVLKKINHKTRTKTIEKSIEKADLNYCISEKQVEEYSSFFNKDMKLLFKGNEFKEHSKYYLDLEKPLLIRYIGSVMYGRWRTLSLLALKIQEINNEYGRNVFQLEIYSQYEPSKIQLENMVIEGVSKFNGGIPSNLVEKYLRESDIVLHLESLELEERMSTRLSFSTKIVDCLHSGRTLMAIGWEQAASISYLRKNDVALVSTNENEIENQLIRILKNPLILEEYANKSWNFGKKNHQIETIQHNMYSDFRKLIGEN